MPLSQSIRQPFRIALSRFRKYVSKIDLILVVAGFLLLGLHISLDPERIKQLIPETVYQYRLAMFFEPEADDVMISTFLPQASDRQEVLDEEITAQNMNIDFSEGIHGRSGEWSGGADSKRIDYRAMVTTKSIQYEISKNLTIPLQYSDDLQPYLQQTADIPIDHPEIKQLWSEIKPANSRNTLEVATAIYQYIYQEIETVPFKGLTDSLTTMRLKSASCNGKSRLFVSLARLNNIPARLVGGVIMKPGRKKTSHQWLELYIDTHWTPIDPTNGHFGLLPNNYLELYRGDKVLFRHTSNINFEYYFNASNKRVAPSLYRHDLSNSEKLPSAATHLQAFGLTVTTISLFLLFPFCTLIITFLRNVIGIKTFGIFMPMLIAAACVFTGFFVGMVGFVLVLGIAYIGHEILGRFHILKVPRLAAIITLNNVLFLAFIYIVDADTSIEFGMLSLFPVVILSFVAERLHQMTEESNWMELFKVSMGTLVTIVFCYMAFVSVLLQGVFSLYPETYLLVMAALIYIGSWSGIRISEIFRFKSLFSGVNGRIMGINSRNRDIIYPHNSKQMLKLASDKLDTKELLNELQVPVPTTISVCRLYKGIDQFMASLPLDRGFVLKPNNGSRGNGILVVVGVSDGDYLNASGDRLSLHKIRKHVEEILSGAYSQSGSPDSAYIEEIVSQHKVLNDIAPYGLSDIRLIISNGQLLSAMLRVPTLSSSGKANLHQGAIGIAVDLDNGTTFRSVQKTKVIEVHPDSDKSLIGISIPDWEQVKEIAMKCYRAVPLGYLGVDICLDSKNGPVVLEINGRPGLEIQNVHKTGLYNAVTDSY